MQSIPTVYAFWEGKPIDAFQGALPASEVQAFVDKVVAASGGSADDGIGDAIVAAEEFLAAGEAEDAAQTFSAILGESPNHPVAYSGLVRALIALNDLDQAEAVLNGASTEIVETQELETAYAQLELAKQSVNAGPIGELRGKVDTNPEDHQARLDLAQALYASGEAEEAVDELLELFRRDKEWNEGAAKAQLFTIFEALPPNDPIVLNGRRKLSSLIFA